MEPLEYPGAVLPGDTYPGIRHGNDDVVPHTDGSVTVDLIALKGFEAIFASRVLDPGYFTHLRLQISSAELVENGQSTPLKIPSGMAQIKGQFFI